VGTAGNISRLALSDGGIMKLPNNLYRGLISVVLALAVTMVFSLRSFAAAETRDRAASSPAASEILTGTLTVRGGLVRINGNEAPTGTTVLGGSIIATEANTEAMIDLGDAGRLEVGSNTTVSLAGAAGMVQLKSDCPGKTEIKVSKGTVEVTSPRTETITAGHEGEYDGEVTYNPSPDAVYKIECERRGGGGYFVGPGLIGLLALIGVGAAVAIGIAVGNAEGGSNVSSPNTL
jgi:hypothetical protein